MAKYTAEVTNSDEFLDSEIVRVQVRFISEDGSKIIQHSYELADKKDLKWLEARIENKLKKLEEISDLKDIVPIGKRDLKNKRYSYTSEPIKTFEGREFYGVIANDKFIVGYIENKINIPPSVILEGDCIVFKEAVLLRGDLLGGVIRGGEINGVKIISGEINGGSLTGGTIYGGIINSGLVSNGDINGGEINGAKIFAGTINGGTFNQGVTIINGVWNGGVYDETPMQVQSKDYFSYMQMEHGDTPKILTIGCESHPFEDFDCDAIYLDRYVDKMPLEQVQEIKNIKQLFTSYYGISNT